MGGSLLISSILNNNLYFGTLVFQVETTDADFLGNPGNVITSTEINHQGPDFDDMSSFLPCEIDNAILYINLGYGA